MKIVHTSDGPAVETDDGDIILPRDYADMVEIAKSHPQIVGELMVALVAAVTAMLPVSEGLKVPSVVDADTMRILDRGVNAADCIRCVVQAVNTVAVTDSQEEAK